MRDGHFLNQWGPQVIQLPAGIIEGSDGKTYRSRLLVGEPNKNEKKICDPCDNKCNSQQILKVIYNLIFSFYEKRNAIF